MLGKCLHLLPQLLQKYHLHIIEHSLSKTCFLNNKRKNAVKLKIPTEYLSRAQCAPKQPTDINLKSSLTVNDLHRTWSKQLFLLSAVGKTSVFDGNIQIQEKMAINLEASDLTLSYRKVVQIELVSEIINAKNVCFRIKSKARSRSHKSILLSVVGQSSHID